MLKEKIEKIIKDFGMKNIQAANFMNISVYRFTNVMRGKGDFTEQELNNLTEYLKLKASEL